MSTNTSLTEAGRGKEIKRDQHLSAVRGGTIVGDHDVIFAGTDEVVTFSHTRRIPARSSEGRRSGGEIHLQGSRRGVMK